MDSHGITDDTVRQALQCIRTARSLSGNDLLSCRFVGARLAADGIEDSPGARELGLAAALHRTVEDHLRSARAGPPATPSGPRDRSRRPERKVPLSPAAREQLERDFLADDERREAWSALYYRYLAVPPLQIKDIAAVVRSGSPYGRTHVARRIQRGIELLTLALRELEVAISPAPGMDARTAAPPDRAIASSATAATARRKSNGAVHADYHRAAAALRRALPLLDGAGDADAGVSPGALRILAGHAARTADEHQAARIATWCEPRYRLDKRFVRLTMWLDHGEAAEGGRWRPRSEQFDDMMAVLAAEPAPALVLLGAPGSGKSTVLCRLELDLAAAELAAGGPRLTFLVMLSRFRAGPMGAFPAPADWLAERWRSERPDLPPLAELLAAGVLDILLDGLNELPHRTSADYWQRVGLWRAFVTDAAACHPGNRFIFACRSLDYSTPLSSPDLRVPQVQLEPLSDEQIREFLQRRFGDEGEGIWSELSGSPQLSLLRTPYYLIVLADQLGDRNALAGGSAGLISGYVRRALRREVERDNPLFQPDWLLTLRDRRRLLHAGDWRSPYDLPEQGPLIPGFAALADGMQRIHPATNGSQVRLTVREAEAIVGLDRGGEVLQAGADLGVLDEDVDRDEVAFGHQLVQEYFAARRLAAAPEPALLWAPWRAIEVRPSLRELIDTLPIGETLPPLPQTGWEETALLAAPMAADPEAFVRGLMTENLVVAGRCANLPELRVRLSQTLLDALCWALVARSRDPAADLRARIAAALELGWLGDPRFERRKGPFGEYLMPPLVDIPGGVYPIGDDEPIDMPDHSIAFRMHMPGHDVEIAPFRIGQFALTNAEWACFIAAGGYDEPRWWDTAGARAYQRGEGTAEGLRWTARHWRRLYQKQPGLLEAMQSANRMTDEAAQRWARWLTLSEEQFEIEVRAKWPDQRVTEPLYWRDASANHPSRPIVGISWYEVRAYCNWLSAQTGLCVRMPTEVEWEAAARGREGRRYAFGEEFDVLRCNVLPTRLHRSAPVGVFVEGDTPEGVCDMAGNINEETSSAFSDLEVDPDLFHPAYAYPYNPDDGREEPDAGPHIARTVHGGSWNLSPSAARASFRAGHHPAMRIGDGGGRIVVEVDLPATAWCPFGLDRRGANRTAEDGEAQAGAGRP